jgi:predicted PurR-regulated permease PerM
MSDDRLAATETSIVARHPRLVQAGLVLAAVALSLYILDFGTAFFFYLGDVILVFFLAWLIAFMVSPIAGLLFRAIPLVSRAVAVVVVYVVLVAIAVVVVVYFADLLARSVTSFLANAPGFQEDLPTILAPLQERLRAIGLNVDVVAIATGILDWAQSNAAKILAILQDVAFASLGVVGNTIIVFVLSIYIAVDRDHIVSFLYRVVPPRFSEEARLFQTSVGASFGGFIRSQVAQGVIFAILAGATSAVLGLPFAPLTAALAGILQAIPFFGPFISWSPPVVVAVFTTPEAIVPALVIMGIGWFITMNVIQPRLMAGALRIHPIVVLGSVLIGGRIAGIAGAIFAIPIAAVASAFFFWYLNRTERTRTVSARAAERVSQREGRPVRVPREPGPDEDLGAGAAAEDVDAVAPGAGAGADEPEPA